MEAPSLSARERILGTAHDLFYRDGIRATGIDKIIAEAGVAKLTFYRHFPSKDELVRAFLEERHTRWMAWFVDALGRHGASTGAGLTALQDALAEWFANPAFRGCAFINSVVEVDASVSGAGGMALRHKLEMEQVIAQLLPAGAQREALAQAAALAVDGAIVRAQMHEPAAALAGLTRLLQSLVSPRPRSAA